MKATLALPERRAPGGAVRGTVVPESRRPRLLFDHTIPRHFVRGNAVATHLFNGLNMLFPLGERFFIRSVMDQVPRIHDALLLTQVKGFVAQEGVHAHEHDRYFDVMRAMGYRTDGFRGRFRTFMRWIGRLPAPLRISITAAAEHYTATFSALALDDEYIVRDLHPMMRKLIVWHCTEEIEHKAVAFDVLQATHPSYYLRVLGFAIASVGLLAWAGAGAWMLLRQDGVDRTTFHAHGGNVLTRNDAEFPRTVWRNLRAYLRRSFHPNDIDNLALARQRMADIGLLDTPIAYEVVA